MSRKQYQVMLCGPVIVGNQRIADNFLESESFIRGSVIRAGFAKQIAYACPLTETERSVGGGFFMIEQKSEAACAGCKYAEICRRFSEMRFSYVLPEDAVPAPFTGRICKKAEDAHPIQDILIPADSPQVICRECPDGEGRMESLKGFVRMTPEKEWKRIKVQKQLSTHTSILAESQTVREHTLFSINALCPGQIFSITIDDCQTGLVAQFDTIYVGKYSSNGYGKIHFTDCAEQAGDSLQARIGEFQRKAKDDTLLSMLFLSDMRISVPAGKRLILTEWEKLLFEAEDLPFTLEKIYTETTLYSGYDTSRKWGKWRDAVPDLLMKMGTSLLLRIKEGQREAALSLLARLEETGIGERCSDGYGQIAVCHPLHTIGRSV